MLQFLLKGHILTKCNNDDKIIIKYCEADLCARALRTPIGGVRLTNSPPPVWTDLTDFPDGEIWKFHQQERNLVELSDWGVWTDNKQMLGPTEK